MKCTNYVPLFLNIIFIPTGSAFCEAYWISNVSTAYSSSDNLTEPGNAISALTFTIFGLIGLSSKNYTLIYYLIMNLFIMTGITSFMHHYYYSDTEWAYAGDIITIQLLSSLSLFYIICDNEYCKFKCVNKLSNLLITILYIISAISYKIEYNEFRLLFKITVSTIIATQCVICFYVLCRKSDIKYKILASSLWNGALFAFGVNMWYLDNNCPEWMWRYKINGHALWHISTAWSLFNTINITNVCRYSYINIKYKWKPLLKCAPWFLYKITLEKERNGAENKIGNMNLGNTNSATAISQYINPNRNPNRDPNRDPNRNPNRDPNQDLYTFSNDSLDGSIDGSIDGSPDIRQNHYHRRSRSLG